MLCVSVISPAWSCAGQTFQPLEWCKYELRPAPLCPSPPPPWWCQKPTQTDAVSGSPKWNTPAHDINVRRSTSRQTQSRGFDFETHFFTQNLGLDRGLEDQVFQDGGKWCDSYSSPHQNRHLKVIPLLVALTKRAIQVELQMKWNMSATEVKENDWDLLRANLTADLWIGSKLQVVFFSVKLSESAGPGSHSSDVQAQGLLVWCWCEREWVVLVCVQHQARNPNPLAWTVHKARRPLEFQVGHSYRQDSQKH